MVHDCHSDFVLFPRDQTYLDMLDSRQDETFENIVHYTTASDMHHFSDLASTTYETYPPTSAFSTEASTYYSGSGGALNFVVDVPKDGERMNRRQFTPSGSRSPSISQSLDHPPSTLSSTSGASAQSTASSAAGSPYSHDTNHIPSQEHWTDSHQGLGIAPGIAHNEGFGSDLYPLTNIDNDLIFSEEKFPNNFVGESRKISLSSISTSSIASPVPASVSSYVRSQSFVTAFHSSPLALDTPVTTRDVTIDTILKEVNSRIHTPTTALTSPTSTSSIETTPRDFGSTGLAPQSSPRTRSSFKSPTTPASAMSPLTSHSTPPSSVHPRELRRNSLAPCSDSKGQQSPTTSCYRLHRYGWPTPPPSSQSHSHTHQSQSPFFGQSSGRFIAPLESSCWFSLIARSLAILYFSLL